MPATSRSSITLERRSRFLVLIIIPLCTLPVFAQPPQATNNSAELNIQQRAEKDIAVLIEQLADPSFRKREEAKWQLKQFGLIAFEQLRVAAKFSDNIQIAREAKYILDSQETIWWSDSDSMQVRTLLRDYSSASLRQKLDRIELLGGLGSSDSWLALCRLARYEYREDLSKLAALELIDALVDSNMQDADIYQSLRFATGKNTRPSIRWILESIKLLPGSDSVSSTNSAATTWQGFLEEETAKIGESMEAREAQIRFCQLADKLLVDVIPRNQRLQLLEANLPKLISSSSFDVLTIGQWAVDNGLPEFTLKLSNTHQKAFEASGENTYLLAEAQLRLGKNEAAQQTANTASQRMDLSPKAASLSKKHNLVDLVARNRFRLARRLESRGLYDWAKVEYVAALGDSSSNIDVAIRKSLANFHADAEDYASAAETLEDTALAMQAEIDAGRSTRGMQAQERVEVISLFYLNSARAQAAQGNLDEARKSIRQAYEFNRDDENIVIVIKQLANGATAEFAQFANHCFEVAVSQFQNRIFESEQFLTNATERERRSAPRRLANDCNRLAWLLANTDSNIPDAVLLSRQSLELVPNWPNFLDTLAACYTAAGDLPAALEQQEKAVAARPFDRVLNRRLNWLRQSLKAD